MGRQVIVVESDYTLPIEDEWYAATLTAIEDGRSQYGATFKWIFELSVAPDEEDADNLNGLKLNALTSAAPSLKNYCGRIVNTLSGLTKEQALGKSIDVDELIGIACEIKTTHKDSAKGGKFANVTSVRLPTGRTLAAPAPDWGGSDGEETVAPPKSDPEPEPEPEKAEPAKAAPAKTEAPPPVQETEKVEETAPVNPVDDAYDIPF